MSHVPGAFVSLKEDCAAAKLGGKASVATIYRGPWIPVPCNHHSPVRPPPPPSMRATDMANSIHIFACLLSLRQRAWVIPGLGLYIAVRMHVMIDRLPSVATLPSDIP